MRRARGGKPRSRRSKPFLNTSDFRAYLTDKAASVAPGDVRTLLARAGEVRQRAAAYATRHPRLGRQIEIALDLLRDHAEGRCPQIPYGCVALLAVAILYMLDPVGVIPDWVPGVGMSDDALVLELAFELGAAGIERYCLWKDLPTDGLLPGRKRRRRSRAKRQPGGS